MPAPLDLAEVLGVHAGDAAGHDGERLAALLTDLANACAERFRDRIGLGFFVHPPRMLPEDLGGTWQPG